MSRHENYEILNLIGYGLATFNGISKNGLGLKVKKPFTSIWFIAVWLRLGAR